MLDFVDPDKACLHGHGGAVRGVEIIGPDRGGEAIFDRVDVASILASSLHLNTPSTGPKISSRAMRFFSVTANTVGSI